MRLSPRSRCRSRRLSLAVPAGLGAVALLTTCGCGATPAGKGPSASKKAAPSADPRHLPGVAPKLRKQIPRDTRQVVLAKGSGPDAIDTSVAFYERHGKRWHRVRTWSGHNGKKGWTSTHRMGDNRTPIGVFDLTDAGGVLPDPGTKLHYTESPSFAPPAYWGKRDKHIFDYTIAINYNRVPGSPPTDQRKPKGQRKGGNIWLHMDNGRGTAACVSQSRKDMRFLLRTLDPKQHPVIVMGDHAHLAGESSSG